MHQGSDSRSNIDPKRWKIESPNAYLHNAKLNVLLGENEKAMDWLELAYIEADPLPDVPYWYSPNDLHSHPRFIALMKKMGLPWKPESIQ